MHLAWAQKSVCAETWGCVPIIGRVCLLEVSEFISQRGWEVSLGLVTTRAQRGYLLSI